MMNQGTGAPDASLPRLLQTDTPTRTMTLSSLPILRQALTTPGPGPLPATAAAGGSTAYSAAIGQVALKLGRMMSTPGVNHPRSHGIGRRTTQYAVPDRPAREERYKDFFPCFWSVPLGAASSLQPEGGEFADGFQSSLPDSSCDKTLSFLSKTLSQVNQANKSDHFKKCKTFLS